MSCKLKTATQVSKLIIKKDLRVGTRWLIYTSKGKKSSRRAVGDDSILKSLMGKRINNFMIKYISNQKAHITTKIMQPGIMTQFALGWNARVKETV